MLDFSCVRIVKWLQVLIDLITRSRLWPTTPVAAPQASPGPITLKQAWVRCTRFDPVPTG
jgi:hypothetical protein